jgi:hypothetical protein
MVMVEKPAGVMVDVIVVVVVADDAVDLPQPESARKGAERRSNVIHDMASI